MIVSLRRMNRVLEINEELGYAVVEPGVRWFDLYEAIQAGGHKLMLSIPDLGWGSVVGNTLDHGITYLPYGGDMARAVRHGGRARRTATLMRTGMGAMPGNQAWHLYKRGLGPTPDQLFMQSNFGIVTKMGIWLMPEPECYMPLVAAGLARRGHRRRWSTSCAADARRHDRERAADLQHAPLGVGARRRARTGTQGTARSPTT